MKNLHNISPVLDEYDQAIWWYVYESSHKASYAEDNLILKNINGQLYYTDIYDSKPHLARMRWSITVITKYRARMQ